MLNFSRSLYRYRVVLVDNTDREVTVMAYSEGDAFRKIESKYPNWVTVELVHTLGLQS